MIVFTSKQCSSSSVSKIMNLNSQFYVRKKKFLCCRKYACYSLRWHEDFFKVNRPSFIFSCIYTPLIIPLNKILTIGKE